LSLIASIYRNLFLGVDVITFALVAVVAAVMRTGVSISTSESAADVESLHTPRLSQ